MVHTNIHTHIQNLKGEGYYEGEKVAATALMLENTLFFFCRFCQFSFVFPLWWREENFFP
jgi:hypothetical protein